MPPKVAALVVAASLTIGWLLASIVSPPVAELQVLPERAERRGPARNESVATPYTEKLHLRLQQAPLAPVTRRNPFVFGSKRILETAPTTIPKQSEAETEKVEGPVNPIATGPSLRLSGIGSTGNVHTAVISDGRAVHLAKVGDTVNGYSIVEISEDAVTIADAAGAQWKLRLR